MTSPFAGLSAFPLTPFTADGVDEAAFTRLVQRLADAGVDSIGALGSTGSYAYLALEERARLARRAVEAAGDVPVIVGVGAVATRHVLRCVEDAQRAGAAGVLLAPVSYQALTPEDVYGLYADVTRELSVPLVVYDNPGTTHFTFPDELYTAIARLPHVASIKLPGVPADLAAARERVERLRSILPAEVALGVSGDVFGAVGLSAGCDAWYSVIAGTLPGPALAVARAAAAGDAAEAARLSAGMAPLWELFARHGSLRVTAAVAEQLGLVDRPCLPRPLLGLDDDQRAAVARALEALPAT